MADLAETLADCVRVLEELRSANLLLAAKSIPSRTLDHWSNRIALLRVLEGTTSLIPVRVASWTAVTDLCASQPSQNGLVRFGQKELPFHIARHLALSAYVCTKWAIYDRLANYCGRIAGASSLAEDASSNPKLLGNIIDHGKKDVFGFACHSIVLDSYAWPIRVAYKIRNWIVHEGVEEGAIPMFASDQFESGLTLHADAKEHLLKCGSGQILDGRFEQCRVPATDEKWSTGDLHQILPQYQEEIDTMFCALVAWATYALQFQMKFFSERDR